MVVKLQVNLADVRFRAIQQGEFVGSIGHFGYFQEGSSEHLLVFVLETEFRHQLLLLGVDLHGEGLVPTQLFLFDIKGGSFEHLFAHSEFDEGALLDGVERDSFDYCGFNRAFGSVAIIFFLCLLLLVFEYFNYRLASFFAHVGYIQDYLFVDVVLFAQVDETHSQKLFHPLHFTPILHYHSFHLRFWELEMLIEDVSVIFIIFSLLLCLVIHFPILEDYKGGTGHIFGSDIVELQGFD